MSMGDGTPLSAARSGKIVRRAKKERAIALPAIYTILGAAGEVVAAGTFRVVSALCPKVNASTLKRRLDTGERKLDELKKKPRLNQGRRKQKGKP